MDDGTNQNSAELGRSAAELKLINVEVMTGDVGR